MDPETTFTCPVCGQAKPMRDARPDHYVSGPVRQLILKKHPDWGEEHVICQSCLRDFRQDYLTNAIREQLGEVSAVEEEVLESLRQHDLIVRDVGEEFDEARSFGQRLADRVASFGGSWFFISIFGGVLLLWIVVNSQVLISRPFDPYPYILLNLVLSCLAAIQAPIIMMSQNRQEAKDRITTTR